jgi:phage terminase large subunit
VHTAWDIGVRDDTSIWWFQVIGGGRTSFDCYTASGVGVDHYAEICHAKPWPRGVDFVPHDAKVKEWGTGRTRVETMQLAASQPAAVSDGTSKLDGIQAARTTLQKAIFHPRCEDIGIRRAGAIPARMGRREEDLPGLEVHDWTSHLGRRLPLSGAVMAQRAGGVSSSPSGQVMLPGPPEPVRGARISSPQPPTPRRCGRHCPARSRSSLPGR